MSPKTQPLAGTGSSTWTLAPTTTLPMLEIYTAPASCSSSWTYEPPEANSVSEGLLLQNAAPSDDTNNHCMPTGWGNRGRVPPAQVYSPGYCPHGYTSADVAIQPPVTTAICCPSHFEYTTDSANTQMGCTSIYPEGQTTRVKVREGNNKRTQIVGPITMWAQAVIVAMEKDDSTLFVTSTSSAPAEPTSTESVPTETGSLTNPTGIHDHVAGDENTETSGLSMGGAIGVGVGVGVGGLALLLVVGLLIFRRRKQTKRQKEIDFYNQTEGPREAGPLPPKPKPTGHLVPSELATNPHGSATAIHEMG